jgi:phage gpG-like protein
VGAYGDAKYAAIHEYGGRTSAHEILPAKAQALCFMVGGATRFARRVQHPGSNIPARSYLSSALQDSQEQIVAELSDAVAQVWS